MFFYLSSLSKKARVFVIVDGISIVAIWINEEIVHALRKCKYGLFSDNFLAILAQIAQGPEHLHGKQAVAGSNPVLGKERQNECKTMQM